MRRADRRDQCLSGRQCGLGLHLADGPYFYYAERQDGEKTATFRGLTAATVNVDGSRLTIRGKLAGLDMEHTFDVPADRPDHGGTDRGS